MSAEIRFEPGLVPVLKHGSHNQKTHAGGSGGVGRELTSEERNAVGIYSGTIGQRNKQIKAAATDISQGKTPTGSTEDIEIARTAMRVAAEGPDSYDGIVYRGVKLNKPPKPGTEIDLPLDSFSTKRDIGERFAQQSTGRTAFLYYIKQPKGIAVGERGIGMPDENEFLVSGKYTVGLVDPAGTGQMRYVQLIPSGTVEKHGSHNQQSHAGRRASSTADLLERYTSEHRAMVEAGLKPSKLVARLGGAVGDFQRRTENLLERRGLKRRRGPKTYTREEAEALRRQYAEKYGPRTRMTFRGGSDLRPASLRDQAGDWRD